MPRDATMPYRSVGWLASPNVRPAVLGWWLRPAVASSSSPSPCPASTTTTTASAEPWRRTSTAATAATTADEFARQLQPPPPPSPLRTATSRPRRQRSPVWVGRNVAATASAAAATVEEDIRRLSDDVRRALQCPVCMDMCGTISTCCRNGHSTCDECSHTMFRMLAPGAAPKCPVCRSPATRHHGIVNGCPPAPASLRVMVKLMAITKVACANRRNGCPEIVAVAHAAKHEKHCPFSSQVRCMVAHCDWMGTYGGVFRHVSSHHQYSAYDVTENQFVMPDLTFGLRGPMRRMYLTRNVRQNGRLFWVGVARPTAAVVQVTVIMVVDPASGVASQWTTEPPGLKFRLCTANAAGRLQPRCEPRTVCWDRTVLARSAGALERGVSPPVCRAAIYSPHYCVATVPNEHQSPLEALISWCPE